MSKIIIIFVSLIFILAIYYIAKQTKKKRSLYYEQKNAWLHEFNTEFKLYREQKERENNLFTSVTQYDRGTESERRLVWYLLKNNIPPITIFHDLYIKRYKGDYTQIDLVVITKVGILVFEVKEYSGWIFGRGNDPQWTQVLNYGNNKYRFYNPILQNNKHIDILKYELKRFGEIPFFSIIVFFGNCVLRNISYIPKGTFIVKQIRVGEVIDTIINSNPVVNYTDEIGLVNTLKQYAENGKSQNIQNKHIENIRNMLGTDRLFD